MVSMEFLSTARRDVVERAVRDLQPLDVRVVLGARDLTPTLPAQWQESVQSSGRTWTLDAYVSPAMLPRRAFDDASQHFWRKHHWPTILRRWARYVQTGGAGLDDGSPVRKPGRRGAGTVSPRGGLRCHITSACSSRQRVTGRALTGGCPPSQPVRAGQRRHHLGPCGLQERPLQADTRRTPQQRAASGVPRRSTGVGCHPHRRFAAPVGETGRTSRRVAGRPSPQP